MPEINLSTEKPLFWLKIWAYIRMSSNYCYQGGNSIQPDHNRLLWFLLLGLKNVQSFRKKLGPCWSGLLVRSALSRTINCDNKNAILSVSWIGTKWTGGALLTFEFSRCRTHSSISTYYWFGHSGHIAKITDVADLTLNFRIDYYWFLIVSASTLTRKSLVISLRTWFRRSRVITLVASSAVLLLDKTIRTAIHALITIFTYCISSIAESIWPGLFWLN